MGGSEYVDGGGYYGDLKTVIGGFLKEKRYLNSCSFLSKVVFFIRLFHIFDRCRFLYVKFYLEIYILYILHILYFFPPT